MDRVNLPFFYDLGASVRPLVDFKVEPSTRFDLLISMIHLRTIVGTLVDSSTYSSLAASRTSGARLLESITDCFSWWNATPSEERTNLDPSADFKFTLVVTRAKEFETVLGAELQTFDAYQITKKGIYSTTDLIEQTENTFSEETKDELSDEVRNDVNQSGRCLAFDLPTASGFHIMRATETVVKKYCSEFGAKVKQRNWNGYITALKATEASPKVLAVLEQIRELHRNPTIHPGVVLSINDATLLFSIAQSAITAMVDDILQHRSEQPQPALQSEQGSNAP